MYKHQTTKDRRIRTLRMSGNGHSLCARCAMRGSDIDIVGVYQTEQGHVDVLRNCPLVAAPRQLKSGAPPPTPLFFLSLSYTPLFLGSLVALYSSSRLLE